MPSFQYKAVSSAGETLQGAMEAPDRDTVIRRLQDQGHIPISAEQDSGGFSFAKMSLNSDRVDAKDVLEFTQQLANLLASGLPLDRALHIMAEISLQGNAAKLVKDIRELVREGASLSKALEQQHGAFNRLYINMVHAGEVSGSLEQTLQRLSDYLESAQELRETVKSAMVYPIMLLVMAIVSVLILMVFVIPNFREMFDEMGANLPTITKMVLTTGDFIQGYWWAMLIAIIGSIWFMGQQLSNPVTRKKWDIRFLKAPLFGDLVGKMEMARFSRTVGTLLLNGVPVLSSITIGGRVMNNAVLEEAVAESAEVVKTGGSLAKTLEEKEVFPELAVQMIAVGEETGKLGEMLNRVADTYDKEVKRTVERLLAILVPALTLTMALMIGTIVISIIVAILAINDLVG
ncbi:MAG: type II secretion system F family protein [bacterium]